MANLSYKAQAIGLSVADALVQRGLDVATALTSTVLTLTVTDGVTSVCTIEATSEVPAGVNVIGQTPTGYSPTVLTIDFVNDATLANYASPVFAEVVLRGTKVILKSATVVQGTFDNLQYPLLATI